MGNPGSPESSNNYSIEPPDGGYGWFIAFAGFIVYVLIGGGFFSFGVLYVSLLDAFGASKADTALVGSLSCGMGIIGHGISMALCGRFGHRKILIVSGICSSMGYVVCSFTTSLQQIYVVYGLFISFMYWITSFPAISMIRKYFSKKMPIAVGLALSGTGAGQCIFSVLIQIFLDSYGWRGTLIMLGGISLHFCLVGALFRPIEHYLRSPAQYTEIAEDKPENQETSTALHVSNSHSNTDYCVRPLSNTAQPTEITPKKKTIKGCFITGLNNIHTLFKVKRARDYGIPSFKSSSLPAIMGLTQFFGRIFWGVGGSLLKVKPHILYGSGMIISGMATVVSIHSKTYEGQIAFAVIFGIEPLIFDSEKRCRTARQKPIGIFDFDELSKGVCGLRQISE
uniref:Monocarboxylate transporter 4-like n=1 Tax=Saccoglossus kowalevskii TaxID=10224 RepID=A0ABM0M811_SACKO|nr:PREDICTED: monocarboxylate transporter 4-like [Saccoglossus kowalevskii]